MLLIRILCCILKEPENILKWVSLLEKPLLKQLKRHYQNSLDSILKRFQVTTQSIWLLFQQQLAVLKPDFLEAAEKLAQEPLMLTYTSLYIHLLDQFLWGLLDKDEVMNAAEKLLSDIAGEYDTESIALNEVSVEAMMKAWSELFVNIIADNIQRN